MRLPVFFAFVAIFPLYFNSVPAQTTGVLTGKVLSGRSKEPLGSATIRSLSNPSIGTATNVDGEYSLALDTGFQKIICAYIGHANDTLSVFIRGGSVNIRNIGMVASSELLKTVVVSSGKFAQKIEELTVSMEVLKPSLINNKNTTSIEAALEQVPGLTIIDNDPQIRGGSGFTFGVGSRVAVVVDGIPLLTGDAGRPEWNYIPVENISQVEIIKGASSVLYGSSAINGVINVRMAYPTDTPKTVINYSAGGYSTPQRPAKNWYGSSLPGMMNLNLLHSRTINKHLDLVIGGNFNMDQGYIGPAPAMGYIPWDLKLAMKLTDSIRTFNNEDMLKLRGRLNFSVRYRSRKVQGLSYGVNGNGMKNKTNMAFAWLDDSVGLYQGYPGAVFIQDQFLFNIDPFIKYHTGNGTSHSLVTRIFRTDNTITNIVNVPDTTATAPAPNNQSNNGTFYYGEYQLQRHFENYKFTVTAGAVGSIANSYAQLYVSSGTPENKTTNAAGYIQFDKKALSILNLSGGLRYEYFKTNSMQPIARPIFRAGLSAHVLKGSWLRMSYGEGFRYPTIAERFISTKAGLFGIFPNPGIEPETSKNFEVGLRQGFKIGGCMGYVDVAGFSQHYHNTIEYLFGSWDTSVALFGFKFVNTGESRVNGADISLVLSTPESNKYFGVTAMAGYTYVLPESLSPDLVYAQTKPLFGFNDTLKTYKNSSMDTTGNILKYRFRHMIKADVELRVLKFAIGMSYRYYSKMENIDKAFQDIETLTGAIHYLPEIKATGYWSANHDFHVIDARVSYKLTSKQKVSVVANNLFNVPYFLRPLKIESPRTVAVLYIYTF